MVRGERRRRVPCSPRERGQPPRVLGTAPLVLRTTSRGSSQESQTTASGITAPGTSDHQRRILLRLARQATIPETSEPTMRSISGPSPVPSQRALSRVATRIPHSSSASCAGTRHPDSVLRRRPPPAWRALTAREPVGLPNGRSSPFALE
jgi:hypothetical protein